MAAIRGRDTKPELIVRRISHRLGFRFRLHDPNLPGRPDLVFPRLRRIIEVHGCFWHVHSCRFGKVQPATNSRFWSEKREATKSRDRAVRKKLRAQGWGVMTVWECQTRDAERLAARIRRFLA